MKNTRNSVKYARFDYLNIFTPMHLTLALPALNFNTSENIPPLYLPSLNKMLRFGRYIATPSRPSEFYARYLWNGSLLDAAKQYLNIPQHQAAVFASPVWQQMGMHQMDMLGGADIQIRAEEAAEWCAGLNDFLEQDGWCFYVVRPDLWLLTLPSSPRWQAAPVFDVLGQVDGTVRAEGPDSGIWLQKQTEIQMWLYSHPLNAARTAAKAPNVNGLWLWQDVAGSQTSLPLLACDSPWAQFYAGEKADAPYDFAAWQNVVQEHGRSFSDGLIFLDDLVVTRHNSDVWAYKDILEKWENNWFTPLWQALETGRLKGLSIVTDGDNGGCLNIKPKAGRAFWKRRKEFAGRLV